MERIFETLDLLINFRAPLYRKNAMIYPEERKLLYFSHRLSKNIKEGATMKILDKVELVVKLKERIEEAKTQNLAIAEQLQKLLEKILNSSKYKAI
ncbi:hypothetical protein [Hydrogenimonas sp.]